MPLTTSGVLVRYFFNEAASGNTPTEVLDSIASPINLDINYASGAMAYTEISGNRALESTSTAGGIAIKVVGSDKVTTALSGSTTATLEYVIHADVYNSGGARIFGLHNNNTQAGLFLVQQDGTSSYLAINDVEWDLGFVFVATGSRTILHVVIDTAQATNADRLRLYRNGSKLVAGTHYTTPTITQNTALNTSGSPHIVAMNRPNLERGTDGRLFYAALYSGALSDADVTNNYNILVLDDDDDGGSGGGPTIAPRAARHLINLTGN